MSSIEFNKQVNNFFELMKEVYIEVCNVEDSFNNHEGIEKYLITMQYMNFANQNFIKAKQIYREYELDNPIFEALIENFSQLKIQLDEVISKKDSNLSWLYSSLDTFRTNFSEANEFMTNKSKHI
ncbi:hypothetical protein BK128_09630 [Viridibacillus sp. FSL H7-0596]|uniref:hypothetical protein n=1 Tax=Viridibacillus sp. FSL H7-0596 TaxID=1928923 RepID=UPI00096EA8D0|nr:hypothetical protein [Viridibacillus sp. FSL H7-0596]OMC86916.1 hypothetical protein BK128_09630 [Viridibacillus sp. FSL H7-0596]